MFFSPLFYRSFPIFWHNLYIKSKKKMCKVDSAWNPPPPLCTKSIQMFFHIFFTSLTVWGEYSTVQSSYLFFIFTHAPCGSVSQQMDIFSSSSNSFQPLTFCSYLAEKNTSFIPTHDPWPTRHDLTSSPSYVITSVCDSFSDRISNLICIVVNVLQPGHSHVYSHGR